MNAEKYTRKTLEAFRAAQTLAQDQSNQYLTPEHLFCALLDQEEGLPARFKAWLIGRVLHGIMHPEGERFQFDWKWLHAGGLSTKDFIAPSSFAFKNSRMFQMGGKLGAVNIGKSRDRSRTAALLHRLGKLGGFRDIQKSRKHLQHGLIPPF